MNLDDIQRALGGAIAVVLCFTVLVLLVALLVVTLDVLVSLL